MAQKQITIVDYGMGNLNSVNNALLHLGCNPTITDKANVIEQSDIIILPGVGAFGKAMQNLRDSGLDAVLTRAVLEDRKPFLGICLGMQLLADSSEEKGQHTGLGWIPGKVKHIPDTGLRLPHMGWNSLETKADAILYEGLAAPQLSVYFVHSYYFECDDCYVDAYTDYGTKITASIRKDNIHAVQYHPEKSHHTGLTILNNFLKYANHA